MLIIFQVIATTVLVLVVTSDNPIKSDEHLWNGYLISFSLVLSTFSVVFFVYIFNFAASWKREPLFLTNYFFVLCVTILLVLFNLIKSDEAPLKRNIRKFWGILLFVTLFMLIGSGHLQNLITQLGKFLLINLSKIFKRIFGCKSPPHQIKSDVYEAVEIILKDMYKWE